MRFYFSLIFVLFFLAASIKAGAQNYLSFRHNNRSYRPYIPGKEITLFVENGSFRQKISGIIDSVGDDLIFVDGRKIYLQNIKAIRIIRTTYNYKSGGKNLAGAGILLSILCATNNRKRTENLPFYIASGVLFTAGTAMYIVAERTFEINDRNKLIIIKPK